ncbi:Sjogren's syndrome/scleroderma autoantigen 1 family protein [Haladaptatus pallidirubidus]|uniref:Sjogren's syndrome/scleroderma autoantigen 1 (Autoantigen p27) n=1 Tax=Haladaptatus pallidirubidus TaxID=1008152 RepID=A0AAV3UFP5_9EURY|nr:Sjogren's syndrome/scleroderma autoantigen 1 family protein [Haladaptatus pallidirubidus]
MSDFDKEAEREKLRQQYEAEKEERKATQRMSELLLQGATMTGKHCDDCGDPIFRQNGTEFCPTCQQQRSAGESPAEAEATQNAEQEPQSGETESPEGISTDAANIEVEETSAETTGQSPPSGHSTEPSNQPRRAPPSRMGASNERNAEPRTRVEQSERGGTGDLTEARNALIRKLTRLATEAEQTDDVGRARELLAATREGAEALAALDQAKR